jgi:raffinose/stachyose/melibiose transport system substrate-binding protein
VKTIVRLSLAVAVIMAVLLTSCTPAPTKAPAEEPAEEPVVEEPAEEPTEEPAEEPAEDPAEAEEVTVVYWSMWNEDEPQGQVIKQAIEAFEADNPNITVDVVWNGRENRNLVIPALEAGEAIDVFDTGDEWIFAHAAQYATDLESLLDDPAVGVDKSVRDTIMQALLYNFPVEGKAVMMPYQPYAVLWFYNKDHFADAGVEEPKTWGDLIEACQALVDAGHPCITTDVDAYMDILWGYYAERAFGGCQAVTDAMNDTTGDSWNDPKWLQMAEDYASLFADGYLLAGTEGNLYPAGQQALALGEVTMYLNGTWLPTEVQDTAGPDFNWGSFSFPDVEGGDGSAGHVMMGSQAFVIVNSSEHPAEAWALVKWLVGKDAQQAMVDVASVPAIHTDVPWPENLLGAQAAVLNSDMGITWGCDIWTSDVSAVVLDAFQQLFAGTITPEEYIELLVTGTADYWASQQ